MLKEFLQKITLSRMANIATIFSVCIAVYAIISPATVSNYLERVASSSEKTAVQLSKINDDTNQIGTDTNKLAAEIPFWVVTTLHYASTQYDKSEMSYHLQISNPTNFAIRGFSLKVKGKTGTHQQLAENVVIPPNEGIDLKSEYNFADLPRVVCSSAYSERIGSEVYEMREVLSGLRPDTPATHISFQSTDWEFTATEPHPKCQ